MLVSRAAKRRRWAPPRSRKHRLIDGPKWVQKGNKRHRQNEPPPPPTPRASSTSTGVNVSTEQDPEQRVPSPAADGMMTMLDGMDESFSSDISYDISSDEKTSDKPTPRIVEKRTRTPLTREKIVEGLKLIHDCEI